MHLNETHLRLELKSSVLFEKFNKLKSTDIYLFLFD